MKNLITLSFISLLGTIVFGQDVTIPDANFKSVLINNNNIDLNDDDEIQVTEAQAYTGAIICSGWSISDLTGIEAFISLTELDCSNNLLTSIDLSANTMLTTLTCSSNQLISLDVSVNTLMTYLNCTDNAISGLDVSTNTALIYLSIYTNSITSIDVTQNPALTHLWCMFNPLTSLDLSQNTNLTLLQANNCSLTSVNLANGNNTNIVGAVLNNNSNLTCIQVDDETYSTTNWTSSDFNKDAGASYSESCSGTAGLVSLNQNEVLAYPNPAHDHLNISLSAASSIIISDINGKQLITSQTSNSHVINVADLESGVYFIHTNDGAATRFIKN